MDDQNSLAPHMTEAELALLGEYFSSGASVLEFGCGGSTLFFLQGGARRLVSVESDSAWLNRLIEHPVIRFFFLKKHWIPLHVDLGSLGKWGNPLSDTPDFSWLAYHQYCWRNMPDTRFDLALIDGRFRVACFFQILLRCYPCVPPIFFHDFWNREQYYVVLEFADVVGRADTAAVLRAEENIDWKRLALIFQDYIFEQQ